MGVGLKQRYVIPVGQKEVNLLDWELKLSGYGIGRDLIVEEVLKEWMFNGKDNQNGGSLINYVTEAINQEHAENTLIDETPSQLSAFMNYQNELDDMTDCCIEVTTVMYQQMEPYLNEIEDHMVAKGAQRHQLEYNVLRLVGDDVIIEVTDEDESEKENANTQSGLRNTRY